MVDLQVKGEMNQRKDEQIIKTETFLDLLVKQTSVYSVTAVGLFLIVKTYLIGKYTWMDFNTLACLPYSFAYFVFYIRENGRACRYQV